MKPPSPKSLTEAPKTTLEDALARERRRLFGLAYRMLGSASEAEDILQEAFLRARETPLSSVQSPEAFLTTIVMRLCIDERRSARARRETYVGPWLPEPIPTRSDTDPIERSEHISLAFLVVLESLSPLGRAAYLLREVFGYGYDEIASVLDRDERACRQLVSRAKREVEDSKPRFAPSRDQHRRLVESFAETLRDGDVQRIERLLAEEVTAIADGGGVRGVARAPVRGRAKVALYFARLVAAGRAAAGALRLHVSEVNGWPALLVLLEEQLVAVLQIETDGTHIARVCTTVNPDKLRALRAGQ